MYSQDTGWVFEASKSPLELGFERDSETWGLLESFRQHVQAEGWHRYAAMGSSKPNITPLSGGTLECQQTICCCN